MKGSIGWWLAGVLMLAGCTKEVPPASVGIKFNAASGISERLVKPQVVWVNPTERLIVYPTSIKNATYTRAANEGERSGDDSIPASTVEGSILPIDLTVSYHVEPTDVLRAFQNFGTEDLAQIQSDYIRWVAIYGVNVVSGTRSIFDLTSKDRAGLGKQIKDVIQPILLDWGITVDDVYVGEVYPNDQVRKKVDERIAMKNAYELAKVGLQRATIDAQTTLTNAKKDAALNRLLALQGDKVLELKRLELQRAAIEKWDGKPPIIGDGTVPFSGLKMTP